MIKLITSTSIIFLSIIASGQNIDSLIQQHMDDKHVSGLAAIIIDDEKVVWEGYYGLADRANDIPVSDSTIFMLASVSKTITATAIMQLSEEGLLDIDSPINDYLEFDVQHPEFDHEITTRELLTHTSGIKDNWDVMSDLYTEGDSPISLDSFMLDYLHPSGVYYSALNNFYSYEPGSNYNYSNIGAALLGVLVESVSGQDFNEYCNSSIFQPLCMSQTAWFLSELDTTYIARPYNYFLGTFNDVGLYGYPDYPNGQLRTNARSLAKFLAAYMQDGEFDGYQLLNTTTVNEVLTLQVPLINPFQGLIWYQTINDSNVYWGHNGGDEGVSTDMYYHPETGRGYVILTNSNAYNLPIFNALINSGPDDWDDEPLLLDCNLSTTISPPSTEESIEVYPNPFINYIHINIKNNSSISVQLFDIMGKRISINKVISDEQITLDVNNLSKGSYYIVITENGTVHTQHIIKM